MSGTHEMAFPSSVTEEDRIRYYKDKNKFDFKSEDFRPVITENVDAKDSANPFKFSPCEKAFPLKIITPEVNHVDTNYGNHVIDLFMDPLYGMLHTSFGTIWNQIKQLKDDSNPKPELNIENAPSAEGHVSYNQFLAFVLLNQWTMDPIPDADNKKNTDGGNGVLTEWCK